MKNIEDFLKENLRSDVHIDKRFYDNLQEELHVEAINKFSGLSSMDEEKNNKKINFFYSFLRKKSWFIFLAVGVFVAFIIGGGYYLKEAGLINFPKNEITNSNVQFARLYVNSGYVLLTRNGEDQRINNDFDLLSGDILTTSDGVIADVQTNFGRIAIDANTQIVLAENGEKIDTQIKAGTIFLSVNSNYGSEVKIIAENAEVLLDSGSTLVNQNSEVIALDSTFFSKLLNPVYAVYDYDDSTKVTCVAGKLKVKAQDKELEIDQGKEVVVSTSTINEITVIDKDALKDNEFITKVVKDAETTKVNTGVFGDTTAPIVTIISPEDGYVTSAGQVDIKFSSNEDGWYLNTNPWTDITAGQEITYSTSLVSGENNIQIVVKDKAYNKTVKTVKIVYNIPVNINWSADPSAQSDGVHLAWSANGTKPGVQEYKLIRDGSIYQVFSVRADTAIGANWVDSNTTNGTTYSYVVAIYENGTEVARSQEKSVVAVTQAYNPPPPNPSCSVSLWFTGYTAQTDVSDRSRFSFKNLIIKPAYAVVPSPTYKFGWSVSGDCPAYSGYKLVWNESGNPVYPGSSYNYYATTANPYQGTANLGDGTWYVRVGLYNGGSAFNYSNQLTCSGGSCW